MTDSFRVELRDVCKQFGDTLAVDTLSLQIRDGEFFALLGPSGCGKTTTLRMIAGFDLPSEGEVFIHGRAMGRTPPYQRPVNTVFQSYALFPHMSVIDNVSYGLVVSGVGKDEAARRARAAMDSVGLAGYDRRAPSELSGGQQQRVAVARSLVLEPSVMLFDEPLSNLDARLRRSMREEIRALQQRLKLTVAYVTHDQSEALAVSDRIVVMDAGVIAQAGTPQQLYEHPASAFVAGFMGEAMLFDAESLADGRVRLGPLVLKPRSSVAAGAAKLAVRPEAWQIGAAKAPGLPATVRQCTYLGSFLEVTLDTELGAIFVVVPDVERAWPVGTRASLTLAALGVSVVSAA